MKSNEEQTIPSEDYWNTSKDVPWNFQNFDGKSYKDFKTCMFQRLPKISKDDMNISEEFESRSKICDFDRSRTIPR